MTYCPGHSQKNVNIKFDNLGDIEDIEDLVSLDGPNEFEELSEYIEFQEAHEQGKTLQVNCSYSSNKPVWKDTPKDNVDNPKFFKAWHFKHIRIKPN